MKINLIHEQKKWISRKVIVKNLKCFIKLKDVKPGKMCGMVKTHKEKDPAIIITNGHETVIKKPANFC